MLSLYHCGIGKGFSCRVARVSLGTPDSFLTYVPMATLLTFGTCVSTRACVCVCLYRSPRTLQPAPLPPPSSRSSRSTYTRPSPAGLTYRHSSRRLRPWQTHSPCQACKTQQERRGSRVGTATAGSALRGLGPADLFAAVLLSQSSSKRALAHSGPRYGRSADTDTVRAELVVPRL